ncbi:MAG: 50S ribosomal protein L30 [Euryarchaeota archaeon HGW-Euryarchaeota-1]|nr:MAG: 50S ribosomal protein L30 [Euryarchaeota archaeon HGW-Euryarchaeota-1]
MALEKQSVTKKPIMITSLIKTPSTAKLLFIYRVRGTVEVRNIIRETMRVLNLQFSHRATLLPNTKQTQGFLKRIKDFVTYGCPSKEAVKLLLEKRARVLGDKSLTEEHIAKTTKYKTFDELAEALVKGEILYKDLSNIKNYFKLPPAKGGLGRKGIKKTYNFGGALGDRGVKIDEFIKKVL